MNSCAPTADRAVSPESIPDLHIFEYAGTVFAFDPVAVHLAALTPDEAVFIRNDKKVQNAHLAKTQRNSVVMDSLSRKGILPSSLSLPAETYPNIDRLEVMVNATQECNLACTYCFVDRGRFGYGEERTRILSPSISMVENRCSTFRLSGQPWKPQGGISVSYLRSQPTERYAMRNRFPS